MTQTDTSGRLIGLELILLGDSYKLFELCTFLLLFVVIDS